MYLLETSTLALHAFFEPNIPDYAILSHRWEEEEVLYCDVIDGTAQSKQGFSKVKSCCELALSRGWEYVWIDSCCIDKSSSAELSEAINSMFRWYENSQVCYAYLSDVLPGSKDERMSGFCNSKWFTRGWTLQELLAPRTVVFYDRMWGELGTKKSLEKPIASITNIRCDFTRYKRAPVAQKMSWAAHRQTSRLEDMAYCLMGLFGVYMTVLYGEGQNAFLRLQLEIISKTDDESIFAWGDSGVHLLGLSTSGLLARSPIAFEKCGDIVHGNLSNRRPSYAMTNRGLRLQHLTIVESGKDIIMAILNCSRVDSQSHYLSIALRCIDGDEYQRTRCWELISVDISRYGELESSDRVIFVKQPEPALYTIHEEIRFSIDVSSAHNHGFCQQPFAVEERNPSAPPASPKSNFSCTLTPGVVEGLIQDQSGAVFVYHDTLHGDDFAIAVDIIDEHVGANIVLARGDKFSAASKFQSLFCDRGGLITGYEPLDRRRFDRLSRILRSGRSVSIAMYNGKQAGKQCYIVQVTIRPPGDVPWPDDEGDRYTITDELYEDFLKNGGPHNADGHRPGHSDCSWNRVRRIAHKKRIAELERNDAV